MIDAGGWGIAVDTTSAVTRKYGPTRQGNGMSIWNAHKAREANHRWQRHLPVRVMQHSIRFFDHQGSVVEYENQCSSLGHDAERLKGGIQYQRMTHLAKPSCRRVARADLRAILSPTLPNLQH